MKKKSPAEPMHAQSSNLKPGDIDLFFIDSSTSNDDMFLPIAVRKDKRTYTQHPISKFVSNHRLSPTFKSFVYQLSTIEIPKNVNEALDNPH